MNTSTRYSPEVRDRAVRLVLGGGEARWVPHVLPVGMAPRCACSSFLLRHVAGEPNNIIEVELKSVGVIRTALDVAADAMPFFGEARVPVQRYVQSTEIAPLVLPAATGATRRWPARWWRCRNRPAR